MRHRLHILGASGSGTTTLGRAVAERLHVPHGVGLSGYRTVSISSPRGHIIVAHPIPRGEHAWSVNASC